MRKLLLLRSPNTSKGSGRHMLLHFIPHLTLNTPLCFPKGVTSSTRKALSTWKDPMYHFKEKNFTDFQQLFFFVVVGFVSIVLNEK